MKTRSRVTPKGVGGVGMIVEEGGMSRGVKVLRVKSLTPGAPAISCGMIAPGDCLITVMRRRSRRLRRPRKLFWAS
jgi:hypothetical protein